MRKSDDTVCLGRSNSGDEQRAAGRAEPAPRRRRYEPRAVRGCRTPPPSRVPTNVLRGASTVQAGSQVRASCRTHRRRVVARRPDREHTTAARRHPMAAADTKTIAFVLYPGLTPSISSGRCRPCPRSRASTPPSRSSSSARPPTCSRRTPSSSSLSSHTFEQVPALFAIVVPGGGQPTLAACGNQRLIDYVMARGRRRRDRHVRLHRRHRPGPPASSTTAPPPPTGRTSTSSKDSVPRTCTSDGWSTASTSRPQVSRAGIDGGLYLAAWLVGEDAAS